MLEIDQYYPMSCALASEMDEELKEVFNNATADMEMNLELQALMGDWTYHIANKSQNYDNTISLVNFIWYILSSGGTTVSAKEQRNEYYQSKRRRMKHLYSIIREEMGEKPLSPRNPLYMKLASEMYFDMHKTDPSIIVTSFKTKEEYIQDTFEKIKKWYKNSDSFAFNFTYYSKISAKRRVRILLYDIGCYCYQFICDNYHGNIIDGYVDKVPRNVVNYPVFSGISTELPLEYDFQDGVVNIVNRYNVKDKENGTIWQTETLIKTLNVDPSISLDESVDGQLSVHDNITKQMQLVDARNLDATDYHLLIDIYSRFTIDNIAKGVLHIPLRDIVKATYPELRDDNYKKTLERLLKLSNYRINCSSIDEHGAVIGGARLSFFDISYGVMQKPDDVGSTISMISISESSDSDSEILNNMLSTCDKNNLLINIMPSQYLKEQWKSGLNVAILTNMSNRIKSHKVELISFYLQSKRTEIYPEDSSYIPHSTLRSELRMSEARKSQYMDYIAESLEKLRDAAVIVKDYIISAGGVSLTFLPLSKEEETYYRTFAPDILLKKSIGITGQS